MKITTKDYTIEISTGELKELIDFFNEKSSTNRIKPSVESPSNSSNASPVYVPSENTINDFRKIAEKELRKQIRNNQKITENQKAIIKKLIEDEFLSDKEISDRLHIPPSNVNYWRKKLIK